MDGCCGPFLACNVTDDDDDEIYDTYECKSDTVHQARVFREV